MDIIGAFLPEKVKTALKDKEITRDLEIVLNEMAKAAETAAKDPAAGSLKQAFNDAATILPALSTYVRDGKLSMLTMAKLGKNQGRYRQSGEALGDAFNQNNPAMLKVIETLENNARAQDALKRLALKTDGNLFRLEQGADGQCFGVELVTGGEMKIPLKKEDFDEIQGKIADAKKNPPQPPKGPSV